MILFFSHTISKKTVEVFCEGRAELLGHLAAPVFSETPSIASQNETTP